jgi:hypothetical protein
MTDEQGLLLYSIRRLNCTLYFIYQNFTMLVRRVAIQTKVFRLNANGDIKQSLWKNSETYSKTFSLGMYGSTKQVYTIISVLLEWGLEGGGRWGINIKLTWRIEVGIWGVMGPTSGNTGNFRRQDTLTVYTRYKFPCPRVGMLSYGINHRTRI